MAFKSNNASNNNTTDNKGGIPDHKKAVGFLNLYLPNKGAGGGRSKLGAIPLRAFNDREAGLAEWLAADSSRIKILLSLLEIEYNPATQSEAAGFALPE